MDDDQLTHTMTKTEARQGQSMNVLRWMLIFGLMLVIPGLALVWFFVSP